MKTKFIRILLVLYLVAPAFLKIVFPSHPIWDTRAGTMLIMISALTLIYYYSKITFSIDKPKSEDKMTLKEVNLYLGLSLTGLVIMSILPSLIHLNLWNYDFYNVTFVLIFVVSFISFISRIFYNKLNGSH